MKVISFSLWGDNPTYTIGAIKNSDLAAKLFPDWKCIFYCFKSVPSFIIEELKSRSNVVVRLVEKDHNTSDSRGMFNRFLPADEEGIEYMISRDTDSRLSEREKLAVQEWIEQGTDLHIIRDHPYHGVPILGGMWGVRGKKLKGISVAIENFVPTSAKGQDQAFLWKWVWEQVISSKLSCTIHDPFFTKNPFPNGAKRGAENGGVWFVGQCFNERDEYNSQSDLDLVKEEP